MKANFALLFLPLALLACETDMKEKEVPVESKRQALLGGQNDLQYWTYRASGTYGAISGTAMPLSTTTAFALTDEGIATVPLNDPMHATYSSLDGFKFEFYGRKVTTIFVSVNGVITFDDAPSGSHFNNGSVFGTDVGMAIAGWWDDLIVSNTSDLTFSLDTMSTPRKLTFQWQNLRHFGTSTNLRDMQITLYEATPGNLESNMIKVAYGPMYSLPVTTHNDSATVGVKNELGTTVSTEVMACGTACDEQNHYPNELVYRPAPHVYVRKTFSQSYSEITGTDITPMDLDDGVVTRSLPFEFVYYGKTYDQIHISVNGLITFGSSSAAASNVAVGNAAAPNNFIAAWWDDMILPDSMDPNPGSIRIDTKTLYMGGPVNEYIVQWKNLKRKSGDGARHDFQVHLFTENYIETHQFIEIAYGSLSASTMSDNATMGLEDEGGTADGSYKPASDCSPSCAGTDFPSGTVHRYTRPTWQYIYDNYFAQNGNKTLHCYSCHYEFRADTDRHSMTTPSPANSSNTYNLLFNLFYSLDENNRITGVDMMGNDTTAAISSPKFPLCGGTPPRYARTFQTTLLNVFNGHFDPLSDVLSPNNSPILWISSYGNMPKDCTCAAEIENGAMTCTGDYTNEKGRREILTWWSEGAWQN